jgi:hypothetical protein
MPQRSEAGKGVNRHVCYWNAPSSGSCASLRFGALATLSRKREG